MVTLYLLLPGLPYVAFTVAGFLLWKRWHSVATSLVTLGFTAVLVVQGARIFSYLTFQPPAQAHYQGDRLVFTAYYIATPGWQYCVELVGTWVAAVGLLWHASRKR